MSSKYKIFHKIDAESLHDLFSHQPSFFNDIGNYNPILTIGLTGSGKSTLLNYLFGSELYKIEDGMQTFVKVKEENIEHFKIGCEDSSQTLHLEIKKSELSNIDYCDCPGFHDNRTNEERLYIAHSFVKLIKSVKEIRGIMVVVEIASLENSKAQGFRDIINMINDMIKNFEEVMPNTLWVFTKVRPTQNVTVENLVTRFKKIIESEKKVQEKIKNNVDLNESKKRVDLLEIIISNKNNIFIPNILDCGESKKEIERTISKFIVLDKKCFEDEFNNDYRKLMEILEQSATNAYKLLKTKDETEGIIETLKNDKERDEKELISCTNVLNNRLGLNQPEIEKAELENIITLRTEKLLKLKQEKAKYETDLSQHLITKKAFESNKETFFNQYDLIGDFEYKGPEIKRFEIMPKSWESCIKEGKNKNGLKTFTVVSYKLLSWFKRLTIRIYICKRDHPHSIERKTECNDLIDVCESKIKAYEIDIDLENQTLQMLHQQRQDKNDKFEHNERRTEQLQKQKADLIKNISNQTEKIKKYQNEMNIKENFLVNQTKDLNYLKSLCENCNFDSDIIKRFLDQHEKKKPSKGEFLSSIYRRKLQRVY